MPQVAALVHDLHPCDQHGGRRLSESPAFSIGSSTELTCLT